MHAGNPVDSFRRITHPFPKGCNKLRLNLLAAAQRMNRSSLGNRRRGKDHVFVDLLNHFDDMGRGDDVSNTPACHDIIL